MGLVLQSVHKSKPQSNMRSTMKKIFFGLLLCLGSQAFGMNRVTAPAKRLALSSVHYRALSSRWPLLKPHLVKNVNEVEELLQEVGNSMKNATVLELFEKDSPYANSMGGSVAAFLKLEKRIKEAESKLSKARLILDEAEKRNHNDEPIEGIDFYWHHSFGAAPYMVWIDKKD